MDDVLVAHEIGIYVADNYGPGQVVQIDPDKLFARRLGRRSFFRGAPLVAISALALMEAIRPRAAFAATQQEWTAYNTPDTAVPGASMNGLTTGSFALGNAIDNSAGTWTDADLWLALVSALTTAASPATPAILTWLLPSLDGTNYPTTGGSTTAGTTAANLSSGAIILPAGTGVQYMALRGISVPPAWFKIQIQNSTGSSFPASSSHVCSLYRYRAQNV